MQFGHDRTGFPLVRLNDLKLEVALLPGTKWQFEQFLADPGGELGRAALNNDWYEEVVRAGPRASWRNFRPREPEGLFLTGVFAPEVLPFARWLGEEGPSFDLPTVREWRAIDRALLCLPLEPRNLDAVLTGCSQPARTILLALRQDLRPQTWGELALLREGVVEWAWKDGDEGPVEWGKDDRAVGLGVPRQGLIPNTLNPQKEVWCIRHERLRGFGFRLVRRPDVPAEGDRP